MKRNSLLLALLLLAVGYLYSPVLHGSVFFQRDIYNYWRPHIDWALASLARGEWLGWNPAMQFGMPFLADPNFQMLYPPTWLLLIVSPETFYSILVLGHAVLAGAGVALLLRSYGFDRGAGAGAVAMALSGPFVSMANLWHHYCGAAWIPWVVWGGRRLALSSGASWAPFATILALQALAGSAESVVMSAILTMATQAPRFRSKRALGRLALATVLGSCIAAIQWMPAVSLLASSARKDFSVATKLGWSLPPWLSYQLVVAGDPRTREVLFQNLETPMGDNEIPLLVGPYLGAFALPLLFMGARVAPSFLWVGLAALLGSFGRYLPDPVPSWLTILPFRYPTKALALVAVTFAVLVGAGAHALLSRPAPAIGASARRICAVLALVIAVAGALVALPGEPGSRVARSALFLASGILATLLRGRVAAVLLVFGIAIDARSGVAWVNEFAEPNLYSFRPPAVDAVLALSSHPRVFVAYPGENWAQADLNSRGLRSAVAFQASLAEVVFPPHGLRFGLRHGFQPEFSGFGVSEMQAFDRFLDTRFRSDTRRYLDLGAIDAVISTENTNPLRESEAHARFPGILSTPTRVDRWGRTPRAALAAHAVVAPSLEAAMQEVASPAFRPGVDVVLLDPATPPGASTFEGGTAVLRVDQNDRVVIDVDSKGPGVLVLRDGLRVGWTASVNGAAVPILRADVLFRGVSVPSGRSVVSFSYTTPGLVTGAVLCVLGLTLLLWLGAGIKVRP